MFYLYVRSSFYSVRFCQYWLEYQGRCCRQAPLGLKQFVVQQSFQLCSALLEHRPKLYFSTSLVFVIVKDIAVYGMQKYDLACILFVCFLVPVRTSILTASCCLMADHHAFHTSGLTSLCRSPCLQLQCFGVAPWILPLHLPPWGC